MLRSFVVVISGIIALSSVGYAAAGDILILNDPSQKSPQFHSALKNQLNESGYKIQEVSFESLADVLDNNQSGTILVLPNAVSFPADAKLPLERFLKSGNHLFAISGPAFSNIVVNANGNWISQDELIDMLANADGDKVIDFSAVNINDWERSTGSPENTAEYIIEPSDSGSPFASLHVKLSSLENWDTFVAPSIAEPFKNGSTITTFAAKGGPGTSEMQIEWKEKDGSRWISIVKLTPEWKRYAVTPEQFIFWSDGSPKNRGGANDSFNPANAEIFTVGLSQSLSTLQIGKPHEYWISDVRAVKDPYKEINFRQPIIESISPQYKIYPVNNIDVGTFADKNLAATGANAIASISRPLGIGSSVVCKSRQIPILYAFDKKGEKRGIVAHLYINSDGDYKNSIWGSVGLSQTDLEKNASSMAPIITSMIDRINGGIFFSNAGSNHFAYSLGERTQPGAYILNLTNRQIEADVKALITKDGKKIAEFAKTAAISSANKPTGVYLGSEQLDPGVYKIKSALMVDGKQVDEVEHEFQVIEYGKLTSKNTVLLDGADFKLDGKIWYPLGMNYWPRYCIGMEPGDYWSHWLSPGQYNPEMIEEDLALAKSLGMNTFSVQYVKLDQARVMMDILARAEKHGIKLHVFISDVHPLDPHLEIGKEMIKAAHLHESPAVWCYDLGWEVNVGQYNSRKRFDKEWHQWVVDRYGSIENAVRDWKYDAEIIDGTLTGPRDNQLLNDGDWRIFVAAYRLFMDDRISKGYKEVREGIRTIDKIHLMGARSGYGGTGAVWIADHMPFDLLSGAKHIDFISPEAYNIGGDRRGFLRGGFHSAYGRHFGGNKPIFWAEYGSPLFFQLEPGKFKNEYTADQYEKERAYYESIIRMTMETYANGSIGWWWSGGMRVDEKSDFGIINPDGTPRPAALLFKEIADEFYKPRTVLPPNAFIDIDRDEHVTGYAGVFGDGADKYVDLLDSGKIPGVRTAGTGTTSANVPLTAVGNVPYNGNNPLKFMNAEFNWVKINGELVANGQTISVNKGADVIIETSMGNIAEAKWLSLAKGESGGVYLEAASKNNTAEFAITADTPFLSDAEIRKSTLVKKASERSEYTLRMGAKDRAMFGEVFRFTIDVK